MTAAEIADLKQRVRALESALHAIAEANAAAARAYLTPRPQRVSPSTDTGKDHR